MSNSTAKRIQRECREVVTDEEMADLGISIEILDDSSFSHIKGVIRGPPDTAYQNGRFELDLRFPDDYPFKPIQAKFLTRVWHPNISSQTGTICLDILKDKWVATLSLRTVLLSIQTLLALPEPSDPQDAVVAKQYMTSLDYFNKTAKFWTQHYARGPGVKDEAMAEMVKKVLQFAKTEQEAISVLSCNEWDPAKAVAYIRS